MTCENRPATCLLSVDVSQQCESSKLVREIHELFQRHRTKALWSFEFHEHPQVVGDVVASASDFGVLANVDWGNQSCDRTLFARELLQRTTTANEMGLKPIALAFAAGDAPAHFDLLVKHQMAIIRSRTDKISGRGECLQPRLARYGIWEADPTLLIPVSSRWSFPWSTRRMMQRAIDLRQTIHIAVNVSALSHNSSAALASLEYVLKLAAARRSEGVLCVVSAHELLAIYSPRREQVHSRSVLRAA